MRPYLSHNPPFSFPLLVVDILWGEKVVDGVRGHYVLTALKDMGWTLSHATVDRKKMSDRKYTRCKLINIFRRISHKIGKCTQVLIWSKVGNVSYQVGTTSFTHHPQKVLADFLHIERFLLPSWFSERQNWTTSFFLYFTLYVSRVKVFKS